MPMNDLTWLRKLVADVPATHAELAIGDDETTTFFVGNPPVQAPVIVSVAGVPAVLGVDFTITDSGKSLTFVAAPVDEAQIVIRYTNASWEDDELLTFLAESAKRYDATTERVPYIYRAALLTLDTTLMGLAASLNFGAGAETFDMASVFQRLTQLREIWTAFLTQEEDDSPVLAFVDVPFEVGDPSPAWVLDADLLGWIE